MTYKLTFNPISGQFDYVVATISPSDITGGTPKTFAAFDAVGALSSAPGVSWVDNGTGAIYSIDILAPVTSTHTDIQGIHQVVNIDQGQVANNSNGFSSIMNVGDTVATHVDSVYPFGNYSRLGPLSDVDRSYAFADFLTVQSGAVVDDIISFLAAPQIDTDLNLYQTFVSNARIGTNDPASLNGYNALAITNLFGSQASLSNASSVLINDVFQAGSTVSGYTILNMNPQIDATGMSGYRGMELGGNFGNNTAISVNDHIDVQTHPVYRTGSTIGSYNSLSLGPTFEEGVTINNNLNAIQYNIQVDSDVSAVNGIAGNNNLGSGSTPITIQNYQDANFNPNFGANVTIDNYNSFSLRPNIQTGASISNNVMMLDIGLNSTLPIGNNATGIRVDMVNFQTQSMPDGLQINNGSTRLSANFDTGLYPVQSLGGPYGLNNIGGTLHVAAGFPITGGNFGIGNNLGVGLLIEDDVPADSSGIGLGFVMNGFLTQFGIAAGKTMDSVTFMGAGAQNAILSTGTFNEISMYRAIGLLPGAGAVVNNVYGFRVDSTLTAVSPTNAWGFWNGDVNANNWFAKNLIIGGSTGQPTGAYALEVTGQSNYNANLISNVLDPVSLQDAATKNYVDASATPNAITSLTGDVTAAGPGAAAATLATVNSNVGTFGSASESTVFTVNAKGLITAAADLPIAIAGSQVSGDIAGNAANVTGTVATANGGTGLTAPGTSGNVLTSNGTIWTSAPAIAATPVYAAPTMQVFTATGGATYNKNYTFVITSGSATVGATYTNNSVTFTVYATVASATQIVLSGSGAPTSSGTLTKTSGTGDSTLTFSQVLAPLYLRVQAVGGGGGGSGSGTGAGAGLDGGVTNFDTVISCSGGTGGLYQASNGGIGGSGTITGAIGFTNNGGSGGAWGYAAPGNVLIGVAGGQGGGSYFGGDGGSGSQNGGASSAAANTGSGGGGGGFQGQANTSSGNGGGAGGFAEAIISPVAASYSLSVGGAGAQGSAGTGGQSGGQGAAGQIIVFEYYQ